MIIWAFAIQALAFATHLYRFRGQGLSPDGRFYIAMAEGHRVPSPYSRRWLMPACLRSQRAWAIASGLAGLAMGPLVYALTGELWCVWAIAWLPGLAISVRFPVLPDQVALSLALASVVAYQHGLWWAAIPLILLSGQCKEVGPMFAAVLCVNPWMAGAAAVSVALSLAVGRIRSVPGTEPYMLHPFRVAMTKHDPLDWVRMVLPWGGLAIVAVAWASQVAEVTTASACAAVSLAMGYGQLLLANDHSRLYQWAAPAVLVAVAGYHGAWLVPAMVAHPFICGAVKKV